MRNNAEVVRILSVRGPMSAAPSARPRWKYRQAQGLDRSKAPFVRNYKQQLVRYPALAGRQRRHREVSSQFDSASLDSCQCRPDILRYGTFD